MKSHNKLVVSIVLIALFIIVTIIYFNFIKWFSIYEIDYFSNLQNEKITEIILKKTVDSTNCVVFTDEDLIAEWLLFFQNGEIKRDYSPTFIKRRYMGGNPTVMVKTEHATYTFYFSSSVGFKINIDGKPYLIKNTEQIPFYKVYDEAVARHGITSLK